MTLWEKAVLILFTLQILDSVRIICRLEKISDKLDKLIEKEN